MNPYKNVPSKDLNITKDLLSVYLNCYKIVWCEEEARAGWMQRRGPDSFHLQTLRPPFIGMEKKKDPEAALGEFAGSQMEPAETW